MNPNKYFEFEYNGELYVVPREWIDEHDKQVREDKIEEVCKQISERVKYWEQCANAVEKESNEYKIFVSLQKNFSDLAEQMQKGAGNE